jgi:hypothetical protein
MHHERAPEVGAKEAIWGVLLRRADAPLYLALIQKRQVPAGARPAATRAPRRATPPCRRRATTRLVTTPIALPIVLTVAVVMLPPTHVTIVPTC